MKVKGISVFLLGVIVIFSISFPSWGKVSKKTKKITQQVTASSFPEDLTYKNQAIDPLCFFQEELKPTISLANCGIKFEQYVKKTGYDKKKLKAGFIGYNFEWLEGVSDDTSLEGYSYYKIIGTFKNSFIIQTLNSGGGTGQFSSLNLITRSGNKFSNKPLRTGDRCNGGIDNAKIENQQFTYDVNLTPYELLKASGQLPQKIQPEKDLVNCPLCCVAKGHFSRDFSNNTEKLMNVDFGTNAGDFDYENAKYQTCFNQLLKTFMEKKRYLKPEQLDQFAEQFNRQCVGR